MRLPVQSAGLNGRRLGKRVMLSGGIQPAFWVAVAASLAAAGIIAGGAAIGGAVVELIPDKSWYKGGRLVPL